MARSKWERAPPNGRSHRDQERAPLPELTPSPMLGYRVACPIAYVHRKHIARTHTYGVHLPHYSRRWERERRVGAGDLSASTIDIAKEYVGTVTGPGLAGRHGLQVVLRDDTGQLIWQDPHLRERANT
jgi:hypothetical protein